jgi:HAE1 family hydrophobic/amphiphilic exporter-1
LNPIALAQSQTGAAISSQATEEIPLPKSYVERMREESTVLDLSLKEAIRFALANNLEIAIENYNEELNQKQVVRARGFYDPSFRFTAGWNTSDSPTTSELDAGGGISVSSFDAFVMNNSLVQNVPGGGSMQLSWNNQRVNTNSTFSFINPRFNSTFGVQYTQPLWKGGPKNTATERQINIFNLDTLISDTQFKQRVAEIVQQVQTQYWELAYSVANYETQRKSMELAIVQHRNNRKRVEIGVMAPIEITSSQAEVARREQTLIQSEVQIINSQNSLKNLLAPDPDATIWNLYLNPVDQPREQQVSVTMEDSIATALNNRPELERLELQQEQNAIDQRFYKSDGKPSVDLRGTFGSTGNSGQVFQLRDEEGNPIFPPIPDLDDPRFGNFTTAWSQVFGFNFINWSVFVDVEIPLRNRANDADLAITNIRERQLASTVKSQRQLVMVEVRNAFETIATRKKSLDAARVARQLAEEQLSGENKRFEAGLSTNFEVLRFQRDLAENQVAELRAIVDYQLALVALEKATYTIIEQTDISLARGR